MVKPWSRQSYWDEVAMKSKYNKKILLIAAILSVLFWNIQSTPHLFASNLVSGQVVNEEGNPVPAIIWATKGIKTYNRVEATTEGHFSIDLGIEANSLLIFFDNSLTPGFDYLPAIVIPEVGKNVIIALKPAASIIIQGDLQFVETENVPSAYQYQIINEEGQIYNLSGFPLSFSTRQGDMLRIPDLSPSALIVPVGINFKIWIGSMVLLGSKVSTIALTTNVYSIDDIGSVTQLNVRKNSLEYNIKVAEAAISVIKPKVTEMESLGFYLVKEKSVISAAESKLEEARQLYDIEKYQDGFDTVKRSYIDLRRTLGDLTNIFQDASYSVYIVIGFLAIASVTLALMITDKVQTQFFYGVLSYSGFIAILFKVYPGSAIISIENFFFVSLISIIFVTGLIILASRVFGKIGSTEVVSLASLIIPIVSIAKRSLIRRKLRFFLTLGSLTVLVMSFVTLTSFSEGYGLITAKISNAPASYEGILLRASSWSEAEPSLIIISDYEITWLTKQSGVTAVSLKIQNLPQMRPLTSISNNPIYSIIGINSTVESKILPLTSILVHGSLPGPEGVALSQDLVNSLGIKIGDNVKIRSLTLQLQGIFIDSRMEKLSDLDGSNYRPEKIINTSPEGEVPFYENVPTAPNEIAILDIQTAQKMSYIGIVRIALNTEPLDIDALGTRLALERGYQVWSASETGITFTRLGSYFEGKGLPLIIPWGIVVLNVVVTMLNAMFERRREISILSSVGLNPAEIASIFVAEASITGFIAGGFGYLSGLIIYRIISVLGLSLEVHQKISAFWSLASIAIAISAVLVGAFIALRSSVIVTPSLLRRWKIEETGKEFGKPWEILIPVRLDSNDIDGYTNHIISRLREYENGQIKKTSNLTLEKTNFGYIVSFIYRSTQPSTGNFYTRNKIIVEPQHSGSYAVKLYVIGDPDWAHETGSLIRLFTMEWSNRAR